MKRCKLSDRKHELFDVSIYECVLDDLAEAISTAAGMDLPGFGAHLVYPPSGFDEEEDEREVRIEYKLEMYCYGKIVDIEGSFERAGKHSERYCETP